MAVWQNKNHALSVPFHRVPRTSLASELGGARRVVAQSWLLERIRKSGKAFDGTINDVEMKTPSEHALLNQSALQMVYSAAPFDKIPPEVLDGHDKLEIVRIWTFEITGLSVK